MGTAAVPPADRRSPADRGPDAAPCGHHPQRHRDSGGGDADVRHGGADALRAREHGRLSEEKIWRNVLTDDGDCDIMISVVRMTRLISRDGAVWQLVGLITRRSKVQILLPQPLWLNSSAG